MNMHELSKEEILSISGGKKWFTILSSAVIGGIVEGFLGFAVGGPAGAVIGFGHGLYDGAAVGVIGEGGFGIAETLHPELFKNKE